MILTIESDPARRSGGYAILRGPSLLGITSVTIENQTSGVFLGPDGRWAKTPTAFPAAPLPGQSAALTLGPEVVDFVPTELLVAIRSGDGRLLGSVFWTDVVPSRNRGVPLPPSPAPTTTSIEMEGREVAPPEPMVQAMPFEPPPPPLPHGPSRVSADGARHVKGGAVIVFASLAALVVVGAAILWLQLYRSKPTGDIVAPAPSAPTVQPSREQVAPTIDCDGEFKARIAALPSTRDPDRILLGEAALARGCGTQAFAAFESADPYSYEPAGWFMARFYDPTERGEVFRRASLPHADWAAQIYERFRSSSSRQREALANLCRSGELRELANERRTSLCTTR